MHLSPNEIWEKGNCRDAPDPDIFYPLRDFRTYPAIAAGAKLYCHGGGTVPEPCPVLLECLLYGLVTEDRFGIWGGMTPRERSALRRIGVLRPARQHDTGSPYYKLIEEYLTQNGNRTEASTGPVDQGVGQSAEGQTGCGEAQQPPPGGGGHLYPVPPE